MTETGDDELTQTHPVQARAQNTHSKWARLRIVYPPEVASTVTLQTTATCTLGRGPAQSNAFKVAHRTVSRSHLALEYNAALRAWAVRDLGSRNGAWVDGMKVGEAPLPVSDGSVVRMGDVLAVFEWCTGTLQDDPAVSQSAIFGQSVRIVQLRADIGRIADDPAPVLLIGDTGTGKESCASELHRLSGRDGPLVTFNCAELSPTVVESQLFGHDKGAFTGATTAHPGLFRSAHGGTLFLDEVGELPLALQPKLLRALQTGEIMPVGGTKKIIVDVRILAATNRNLSAEISSGGFRRDLYARLAIHEVRLPALDRRRSDLLGWIDVLGAAWAERRQRPAPTIELSPDAAELVLRAPWEENLRGLVRLVHTIAPQAEQGPITPEQLPDWAACAEASTDAQPPAVVMPKATKSERPAIPDKDGLLAALETHGWVIQAVARHYGRDRRQIYRWMDNHGIKRRD
ncbi:MAG: sigma 54-interacting transcriptional regulator [Nannocystaceae bacterium]|nr:sigma 54-interacting transcriptional regulator [Nannocystaceae bacterium]